MFENSLIDLDKVHKRGLRWWLFPVALVIHLVAGGALLFAQYWNVPRGGGAADQRDVHQRGASAAPAAPAAAAAGRRQAAAGGGARRRCRRIMPNEPVQPVEVPDKVPEPSSATPRSTPRVASRAASKAASSAALWAAWSAVSSAASSAESSAARRAASPGGVVDDAPLRVGGAVTRPEIINQVKPIYTELARRARVTGTVIVEAIIDQQGNVTNVRVLKGLPMGLDKRRRRCGAEVEVQAGHARGQAGQGLLRADGQFPGAVSA